ncbi:MAG: hypothetical protein K2F87_01890 [Muribaculaceae bacterium]|nr:hypothetical protein [Muribaculaceae bacterium]
MYKRQELQDPLPVSQGVFVYFYNIDEYGDPFGENIYVWAWNEDTGETCTSSTELPGDEMKYLGEELYIWYAPKDKVPTHLYLTNEDGMKVANANLQYRNGRTYYPNGWSHMEDHGHFGITPDPDPDPDPIPDPDPDPDPTPDNDIYVFFKNTGRWDAYTYAWIDSTPATEISDSWPGDAMVPVEEDVLKWTSPDGRIPTHIIISNHGGERAGGKNLEYVNHATYYPDGTYTIGGNENPGPQPMEAPESLYVLGTIEGSMWDTLGGKMLQLDLPGVFVSTEKIKFAPASADSNCSYFNLSEKLGADWNSLNAAANRYGPMTRDEALPINKESMMKRFERNNDAASCTSWMIEPGDYYVRADFNKGTLTLLNALAVVTISIVAEPVEKEVTYYTLQGVKVENPGAGIYIKVVDGHAAGKIRVP